MPPGDAPPAKKAADTKRGKHSLKEALITLPVWPLDLPQVQALLMALGGSMAGSKIQGWLNQWDSARLSAGEDESPNSLFTRVCLPYIYDGLIRHDPRAFREGHPIKVDDSGDPISGNLLGLLRIVHDQTAHKELPALGSGTKALKDEVTRTLAILHADEPKIRKISTDPDVPYVDVLNVIKYFAGIQKKAGILSMPTTPGSQPPAAFDRAPFTPATFDRDVNSVKYMVTGPMTDSDNPNVARLIRLFQGVLQAMYDQYRCGPEHVGPEVWRSNMSATACPPLSPEHLRRLHLLLFGTFGLAKHPDDNARLGAGPSSMFTKFTELIIRTDKVKKFKRFQSARNRLRSDVATLAIMALIPRLIMMDGYESWTVLDPLSEEYDEAAVRDLARVSGLTSQDELDQWTTGVISSPAGVILWLTEADLIGKEREGGADADPHSARLWKYGYPLAKVLIWLKPSHLTALMDRFTVRSAFLMSCYRHMALRYQAVQGRIRDYFVQHPEHEEEELLFHAANLLHVAACKDAAELWSTCSSTEEYRCGAILAETVDREPEVTESEEETDTPYADDMHVEAQDHPNIPTAAYGPFDDLSLGIHPFHVSVEVIGSFLGIPVIVKGRPEGGKKAQIQWPGISGSIAPHPHQIAGATSALSNIWASDTSAEGVATIRHRGDFNNVTLINDATGLGKTLLGIMIITYVAWSSARSEEPWPPVMYASRSYLDDRQPVPDDERESLASPAPVAHPVPDQPPAPVYPEIDPFHQAFPLPSLPVTPPETSDWPHPPGNPTLLVVPPVLLRQWQGELKNALKPGSLHVVTLGRPPTAEDMDLIRKLSSDRTGSTRLLILTTYPALRNGIQSLDPARDECSGVRGKADWDQSLLSLDYDVLVLDEAHQFRAEHSVAHATIRKISARASIRIALTATPCPNQYGELFSIMSALRSYATDRSPHKDAIQAENTFRKKQIIKESLALRKRLLPAPAEVLVATATSEEDSFEVAADTGITLSDMMLSEWNKAPLQSDDQNLQDTFTALNTMQDAYRAFVLLHFGGSIISRTSASLQPVANHFGSDGFFDSTNSAGPLRPILDLKPVIIRQVTARMSSRAAAALKVELDKRILTKADSEGALVIPVSRLDNFHSLGRQASIHYIGALMKGVSPDSPEANPLADTSAKIKAVIKVLKGLIAEDEALPPAQRRKYLIYCHWVHLYPALLSDFLVEGLSFASFTGSLGIGEERSRLIAQIQSHEDHPILPPTASPEQVAELGALAHSRIIMGSDVTMEGLNLTRISVILLADNLFTTDALIQIVGRAARQGQQATHVTLFQFNTAETQDEKVAAIRCVKVRSSLLVAPVPPSANPKSILHQGPPALPTIVPKKKPSRRRSPAGDESLADAALGGKPQNAKSSGKPGSGREEDSSEHDELATPGPDEDPDASGEDDSDYEGERPQSAKTETPYRHDLPPTSDFIIPTPSTKGSLTPAAETYEASVRWLLGLTDFGGLASMVPDLIAICYRADALLKRASKPSDSDDHLGWLDLLVINGFSAALRHSKIRGMDPNHPDVIAFREQFMVQLPIDDEGRPVKGAKRKPIQPPSGADPAPKKKGRTALTPTKPTYNPGWVLQAWPAPRTSVVPWVAITQASKEAAGKPFYLRRAPTLANILAWQQYLRGFDDPSGAPPATAKAFAAFRSVAPYNARVSEPLFEELKTLGKWLEHLDFKELPPLLDADHFRLAALYPYPPCFEKRTAKNLSDENIERYLAKCKQYPRDDMYFQMAEWMSDDPSKTYEVSQHETAWPVLRYFLSRYLWTPKSTDRTVFMAGEDKEIVHDWAAGVLAGNDSVYGRDENLIKKATWRKRFNVDYATMPRNHLDRLLFAPFVKPSEANKSFPDSLVAVAKSGQTYENETSQDARKEWEQLPLDQQEFYSGGERFRQWLLNEAAEFQPVGPAE